jgi:hypothetical protein
MVLDAATARPLLAAAPRAHRPWWRGIVWLARGAAPTWPAEGHPTLGFDGWERWWLAVAEVTSFVAGSCSAPRLHVDAGVVAEIVDARTGAALEAGATGTLALTALDVDAPLLRYATGITARMPDGPCPCGAADAGLILPPVLPGGPAHAD